MINQVNLISRSTCHFLTLMRTRWRLAVSNLSPNLWPVTLNWSTLITALYSSSSHWRVETHTKLADMKKCGRLSSRWSVYRHFCALTVLSKRKMKNGVQCYIIIDKTTTKSYQLGKGRRVATPVFLLLPVFLAISHVQQTQKVGFRT